MKQTLENTNWKKLTREQRGQLLAKSTRIVKVKDGYWRVSSQTQPGRQYIVKYIRGNPECSCPDCAMRHKTCKHIYAIQFYVKRQIDEKGKVTETKGIRVSYQQDWKAYNKSQTNEKLVFMQLLKDLCTNIEQPEYTFGRPTLPLSDMLFASALKVYSTFSLRRFMSDFKIAKEMNLVSTTCDFSNISYFMQREDITHILKQLIAISASPLREVETDFAIDSSGFSTSRFARWFDAKWGKERKYRVWLKAHLISGTKTNIVSGCEITEGEVHDSPSLPRLVEETAKTFKVGEVSGDKAYSSRKNLQAIEDVGAVPFIPFKKNAKARRDRGTGIWKRMYHFFIFKQEEFLNHYHKRSNAETVFHMIKTKFKDNLRSKKKQAQINEVLLKVLCHNICIVIQEMNELGVREEFIVKKGIER